MRSKRWTIGAAAVALGAVVIWIVPPGRHGPNRGEAAGEVAPSATDWSPDGVVTVPEPSPPGDAIAWGARQESTVRVFQLQYADPTDALARLKELARTDRETRADGEPIDWYSIWADPAAKRLIVRGYDEEYLAKIEMWIHSIEVRAAGRRSRPIG